MGWANSGKAWHKEEGPGHRLKGWRGRGGEGRGGEGGMRAVQDREDTLWAAHVGARGGVRVHVHVCVCVCACVCVCVQSCAMLHLLWLYIHTDPPLTQS